MIRDASEIAQLRLRNQHLLGKPAVSPGDALARLCAVQAQDYAGAKWALGQRCLSSSDLALDQLVAEGAILRCHVLRPTWHFVAPTDIHWLLALSAPQVHAANAPYYRKLELDDDVLRRSTAVLVSCLRGGAQLTRGELALELEQAGIPASGMKLAYLMMHAELQATVCSGALRGKQHTYALFSERVAESRPLTRKQALAQLATRYFAGHGPALVTDFRWWSGLSAADAKAAIELAGTSLQSQPLGDRLYLYKPPLTRAKPSQGLVQLLPNYDEYVIAYREHGASFAVPLRLDGSELTSALSNHILTRDGQVIGGWRRTVQKRTVQVTVTLLAAITPADLRALDQVVARYSEFLQLPVDLSVV